LQHTSGKQLAASIDLHKSSASASASTPGASDAALAYAGPEHFIRIFYKVGGGGGHELRIDGLVLTCVYEPACDHAYDDAEIHAEVGEGDPGEGLQGQREKLEDSTATATAESGDPPVGRGRAPAAEEDGSHGTDDVVVLIA
jgi:hypothetical protein